MEQKQMRLVNLIDFWTSHLISFFMAINQIIQCLLGQLLDHGNTAGQN